MKSRNYWNTQFKDKGTLIFDFDRTIATIQMDWDIWREEMRKIIGKYEPGFSIKESISKNVNRLTEMYGSDFLDEIVTANENVEYDTFRGVALNESLIEYIRDNAELKNMFLYTSNSRKLITRLLRDLEMADAFKKVVTRNDVDFIKPHPEGMRQIVDVNSDLTDYLMVGDSSSDRGVADEVNMDFLLVEI